MTQPSNKPRHIWTKQELATLRELYPTTRTADIAAILGIDLELIYRPRVFDFAQQSNNISIIGPLAVTAANGIVYWMGNEKFYVFDDAAAAQKAAALAVLHAE